MPPEIIALHPLYDGWSRILQATVRIAGGETLTREIEDHGDAVAVLPYDPERRVALVVRQLRAPALHAAGRPDLVEAPAGRIEGEDVEACIRREALEEVGLRLGEIEHVLTPMTMPAVSTERIHLYLAPFAAQDRVASGGGVAAEQENITATEMPLVDLGRAARDGGILDMKTVLLVWALQARRPELFA